MFIVISLCNLRVFSRRDRAEKQPTGGFHRKDDVVAENDRGYLNLRRPTATDVRNENVHRMK